MHVESLSWNTQMCYSKHWNYWWQLQKISSVWQWIRGWDGNAICVYYWKTREDQLSASNRSNHNSMSKWEGKLFKNWNYAHLNHHLLHLLSVQVWSHPQPTSCLHVKVEWHYVQEASSNGVLPLRLTGILSELAQRRYLTILLTCRSI